MACTEVRACLVDFGVARVLANQQEVSLAADAACDPTTVSLDVVLSLTSIQGVQGASDNKSFALQAVGVAQWLLL